MVYESPVPGAVPLEEPGDYQIDMWFLDKLRPLGCDGTDLQEKSLDDRGEERLAVARELGFMDLHRTLTGESVERK